MTSGLLTVGGVRLPLASGRATGRLQIDNGKTWIGCSTGNQERPLLTWLFHQLNDAC